MRKSRGPWNGPWWVPVLLALAPSFAWRRRVIRLWCWSDCSNPINRMTFRLRHPVLAYRVHQLRKLWHAGRDQLEA